MTKKNFTVVLFAAAFLFSFVYSPAAFADLKSEYAALGPFQLRTSAAVAADLESFRQKYDASDPYYDLIIKELDAQVVLLANEETASSSSFRGVLEFCAAQPTENQKQRCVFSQYLNYLRNEKTLNEKICGEIFDFFGQLKAGTLSEAEMVLDKKILQTQLFFIPYFLVRIEIANRQDSNKLFPGFDKVQFILDYQDEIINSYNPELINYIMDILIDTDIPEANVPNIQAFLKKSNTKLMIKLIDEPSNGELKRCIMKIRTFLETF